MTASGQDLPLEQGIDLSPDAFVHPNQRRPAPLVAFAWELVRGVNSHLRAHREVARRMVEHVGGAFGGDGGALWTGVGAGRKRSPRSSRPRHSRRKAVSAASQRRWWLRWRRWPAPRAGKFADRR